jgi:hypothetical protein
MDFNICNIDKHKQIIKKNINLITIIDNVYIWNQFNETINNYLLILNKYIKNIEIINMFLITTYPNIKVIKIEKENLFTEFKKIIHCPYKLNNVKPYSDIVNECCKLLKVNFSNEVVMFTHFLESHPLFKNITDYSNTILHVVNDVNNDIFMPNLEKHNVNIDLLSTTLLHTELQKFNINTDEYHCFFVKNGIEKIQINDEIVTMPSNIKNLTHYNDILNAIEFTLEIIKNSDTINKDLYLLMRDILLQYINIEIGEIKYHSIVLYYHLKKYYLKIFNNLEHNPTSKIFIEYFNNSIKSNKNKKMNQNIIIKNMELLNNINQRSDVENITNNNFNNNFNNSCDFFNSTITLTNWFEEVQDNNGLGLLITITKNKVDATTITYISLIDYLLTTMNYFEKNKNLTYGNLYGNKIINGMGIGSANALLPLYINKYHWRIVKKYLPLLLGIIMESNPFTYTKNDENIYFSLFNDMTIKLFDSHKQFLNEKYIKNYIAFLRTCAEICFERKFNRGIKTCISSYINNPINNFDYGKICAQAIVTGFLMSKQNTSEFIIKILNNLIKNIPTDKVNEKLQYEFKFLLSYYKINFIFQQIIDSFGSYSKFIKSLEENYGLIDDITCNKMIYLINQNVLQECITLEEFYKIIG